MKFSNKFFKKLTQIFLSSFLLILLSLAFLPGVTYAKLCSSDGQICNPISTESINGFIKTVLIGLIKIGIPLIAIAIIYSGFLYVTALGKPAAIEKAHQALLYSVIGGAILLGAWAIAQLISDTVLAL